MSDVPKILVVIACAIAMSSCSRTPDESHRIRLIFDTDANNELDDQHALAYLLFNSGTFRVDGVTVNATRSGGNIDKQLAEAERILKLCQANGKVPVVKGADANFDDIRDRIDSSSFDGKAAVDFILERSNVRAPEKLIVLAVGKLTNVALALKKDPSLADRIKVIWLGSNYPDPGEYNLDNDTSSMNYVLNTLVEFEMATVSYGRPTGTAVVKMTKAEALKKMPGKGPVVSVPVEGRHGGTFSTFGDYSASLFDHIDYHDDPPSRSLFDMAAAAIVRNPTWAQARSIPCPIYYNRQWHERPANSHSIVIWEHFDKEAILADFMRSMENYELVD